MKVLLGIGVIMIVIAVALGIFGVASGGTAIGGILAKAQELCGTNGTLSSETTDEPFDIGNGQTSNVRLTCEDSVGSKRDVTEEFFATFSGDPDQLETEMAGMAGGIIGAAGGIIGAVCVGSIGLLLTIIGVIGLAVAKPKRAM